MAMQTATPAEKLLTVEQAATYLGCSVYFLRQLIRKRQVAHVRIGKRFKMTQEALDAWFRNRNHR